MRWRRLIQAGIVLVVLVLCAGMLLPQVATVRGPAKRMMCTNNLKMIGIALHEYHAAHGVFPQAGLNQGDHPPHQRLSYLAVLLPYMEQDILYKTIDLTKEWNAAENQAVAGTTIKHFRCPGDDLEKLLPGRTHYAGIAGVGLNAAELPGKHPLAGFFGHSRTLNAGAITDGAGNTIMTAETTSLLGPWIASGFSTVRGIDPSMSPYLGKGRLFGGLHPDIANMGFADGSVRHIKSSAPPRVLEALATIAGGEEIKANDF